MVISQIAGLATAFGTGELSGAGFGPNYTILMKLGYEFFAPRILEEMEKNPNVFFQDTLWFKKFQKQIKLYSDTVMKETLDTLISIPQETIDKIVDKFKEEGTAAIPAVPGAPNVPITVSPALNQLITLTKVLETLIKAFQGMNFNFNIIPQAFGEPPSTTPSPSQPPFEGTIPPQFQQPPGQIGPIQQTVTQKQILDKYDTFDEYRQNGGLLLKPQWENAKQGQFKPTLTSKNQRIINAVNVTGVFVVGATSHRRATQSTKSLRSALKRSIANLLVILQKSIAEPKLTELIDKLHNIAQALANHEFTYSL